MLRSIRLVAVAGGLSTAVAAACSTFGEAGEVSPEPEAGGGDGASGVDATTAPDGAVQVDAGLETVFVADFSANTLGGNCGPLWAGNPAGVTLTTVESGGLRVCQICRGANATFVLLTMNPVFDASAGETYRVHLRVRDAVDNTPAGPPSSQIGFLRRNPPDGSTPYVNSGTVFPSADAWTELTHSVPFGFDTRVEIQLLNNSAVTLDCVLVDAIVVSRE